jgi:hypothetical protein
MFRTCLFILGNAIPKDKPRAEALAGDRPYHVTRV